MIIFNLFNKLRNYLFLRKFRKAYRNLFLFQNLQESLDLSCEDLSYKDYVLQNYGSIKE